MTDTATMNIAAADSFMAILGYTRLGPRCRKCSGSGKLLKTEQMKIQAGDWSCHIPRQIEADCDCCEGRGYVIMEKNDDDEIKQENET